MASTPDDLTADVTSTPAGPSVSAILVVHNGATWLPSGIDALIQQTHRPDRLVIVDVHSTDDSAQIIADHDGLRVAYPQLTVIRTASQMPFGRAVERAATELRASVPDGRDHWLWLLHDDGAAEPETLERLLTSARRSNSVGVVGPKVVQWDNPRLLVELGHQLTRTGRSIEAPRFGEPDQGQYDHRTDSLAVGSNGMLVRSDVYAALDGFDPSFSQYAADLDFGWRAQLAGHRVIVEPEARIREASAMARGQRGGTPSPRAVRRRQRRATRQVALTHAPIAAAPLLAIWIALSSVVSALVLLAAKRPRLAWTELGDIAAVATPWRGLTARRRNRGRRAIARRDIAGLFIPASEAARLTLDQIRDQITPESAHRRASATPLATGPVDDDAEALDVPASLARRILTNPGVLAVLTSVALTTWIWRDQLRAGLLSATTTGLVGGELRPVSTGSEGLWHLYGDSWHGAGLGTSAESGPWVVLLAGLTWITEHLPYVGEGRSPAGATIAWLIFLGPVLATLTAYLASRVTKAMRTVRAAAALLWGTSAVLVGALAQGRLTVVLAHILLPLVAAGFVLAAGRYGTWTATFATCLAAALLGALVPVFILLVALAALVLLIVGPGMRRARAIALLVVPVALLGPWVQRFVDDWRLFLSGPGLLAGGADSPTIWQLVLAEPEATGSRAGILVALVLFLAVIAMVRHVGVRGRALGLLSAAAISLVGLAVSIMAPRLALGSVATAPGNSALATPWPGPGTQLYLLGLLGAVLIGSRGLHTWMRRPPLDLDGERTPWTRLRKVRFGAAWAVVGALTLVAVTSAVVALRRGVGDDLVIGRDTTAAVAVEQAGSGVANRLLLISPGPQATDYRLIGAEPGSILRDLERPVTVTDPGVRSATRALVDGLRTEEVHEALARQAIGFVALQTDPRHPLVRTMDATAGLTRLGSDDGRILWRVLPTGAGPGAVPPARLVVTKEGRPAAFLPTNGPHGQVDTALPAGSGEKLVVAEPAEWAKHATVTWDGRALTPIDGPGNPTFALPPHAGHLTIALQPEQVWWRLGQAVLLVLVAFLAVPFGNRRSRRQA